MHYLLFYLHMSKFAVQAVLTAVAEQPELKAKLLDPATIDAAVAEMLTLTPEEKAQITQILQNEDATAPVVENVDPRVTPGPGTGGGRALM